MDYNLYFHDDFDGVSSGAVMLHFLRSRGDRIISMKPINYSPALKENWADFKFEEPFILLDFLYHPKARWWFDHHLTAFISPEWQKEFIDDQTHGFDANFKSCCGLVLERLKRNHNYKPTKYILDLVKAADYIDSFSYKSAKEAVEKKSAALKFAAFLDSDEHQKSKTRQADLMYVITQLADKSIAKVIKLPLLEKIIQLSIHKNKRLAQVVSKNCCHKRRCCF